MSGNDLSVFCTNLRTLRERHGLTQTELAEKCNLSPSYVGKIERSDKYPSFETLLRFTDAFDVSLLELFDPSIQNKTPSAEFDLSDQNGDMSELLQFFQEMKLLEEGVCITDRQGRILSANNTYSSLLRKSSNRLFGKFVQDVDPRFEDKDYSDLWASLDPGEHTVVKEDYQLLSNTEISVRFVISKVTFGDNLLLFMIAQPDTKEARSEIETYTSFHDDESGFFNEQFFFEIFEQKLHECIRYNLTLVTGIFSFDGMAKNGSEPDEIPMETVIHLFLSLRQSLRKSDVTGRIGKKEIAFILPNTKKSDARRMIDRVQDNFREIDRVEPSIPLEVGFAAFPSDGKDREELFQTVRNNIRELQSIKQ